MERYIGRLIRKLNIDPAIMNIVTTWLERLAYAYCFYQIMLLSCEFMNQDYQTLKNIYMAKILVYFAVILFIIRKIHLLNLVTVIFAAIYYPLARWYYVSNLYGEDIQKANLYFCIAVGLFGLLVIDIFRRKNILKPEDWNLPAVLMYVAVGVAFLFCRNGRAFPLFFAACVPWFFILKMKKTTWNLLMKGMADAFTVAFIVIMYRSLTTVPFTGGRYWGNFASLAYFGEFLGAIFSVILYRVYDVKKKYGRLNIFYSLNMILLILVLIAIGMAGVRATYLGLAIIMVLCYVLLRKKTDIRLVVKRLLVLAGICIAGAVIGLTVMSMLKNIDKKDLDPNMFLYEKVKYIVGRSNEFFNTKTFADCGVFPEGSLINTVDWFTSGRLSIAVVFLESSTLTGNEPQYLQVGEFLAVSAHNTYLQFIYDYGFISGILFIVLYFYSFYRYTAVYRKRKNPAMLCGLFYIGMSAGILLCETETFAFPNLFFWFILMYPVMTNTITNEKKRSSMEPLAVPKDTVQHGAKSEN